MPTLTEHQFKRVAKKDFGKESTVSLSDSFLTRVVPHSIDAEQALIACCIMEGGQESMTACVEAKVTQRSFFKPSHQVIFQSLMDLYGEGIPVDDVILGDRLQRRGQFESIGGYAYLNEVTNRIDTPAHLHHYLKRVKDLSLLRRLINTSTKTIEEAYAGQEDLEQFLEHVEQEFFKISEDRISETAKPLSNSIDKAVALVNSMIQRKGELTGVTSGFSDLDKLTFGFNNQEMIVIAARPSMGKTALSLNIAEAAAINSDESKRVPTLIFSLEMSAEQIAMRMLCSHSRADMQKLKDGFLDKQAHAALAYSAKALKSTPLWIDDSSGLTILEMRAKARRLHAQKHLGLVVIDYLQLISGADTRVPREQQIAEISRGVKAMAKELNVPVIVAAQLNRESEKEKRQPRVSDLRESGSIEQDADLVLLISKKKDFDEDKERTAPVVMRDLILAKQRNGPIGVVPLIYNKRIARFENYTEQPEIDLDA